MVSELDAAEAQFLQAAGIAPRVPQRRPLHFDISHNLSAAYEGKALPAESCAQLRRAALHRDLLAHPSEPPAGNGAGGERFLRGVAAPRIRERRLRIGCGVRAVD